MEEHYIMEKKKIKNILDYVLLAGAFIAILVLGILEKQDEPSEGGIFANEIMLRKLLQLLKENPNREFFVFNIIEDQYNPVKDIRVDDEDIIIDF